MSANQHVVANEISHTLLSRDLLFEGYHFDGCVLSSIIDLDSFKSKTTIVIPIPKIISLI